MDLQSCLNKLRSAKKKSRSQFRYRSWGRGHALGTQVSVDGGPGPPGFHENDDVVIDFTDDRVAVPQRPGPVIHENEDVVNDLSVDLGDVPQRPGPVDHENDDVINKLEC